MNMKSPLSHINTWKKAYVLSVRLVIYVYQQYYLNSLNFISGLEKAWGEGLSVFITRSYYWVITLQTLPAKKESTPS